MSTIRRGDCSPLPRRRDLHRRTNTTCTCCLISTKVAMDKPTGSAITAATDSATAHERTQFIRYTPNENAPGYNPQASQRIIRMVPKQIDPMQPPKHMHRKAPRGPAEDPVPVLHAPPEKLSKEEREAWNVPACISNWKNTRGYTIPLDKRLAADGRGLRDDATINPNFAVLSESLYVAERQAREEVRTRAAVQKRLVLDQRQRREDELRELAIRRDWSDLMWEVMPTAVLLLLPGMELCLRRLVDRTVPLTKMMTTLLKV
ncbi:SKIP/SNW1 family protein [Skeletonema marinoi]|uniref:SKIP/SNW1 family protein n=1 Tax=Skeletonema marinoi TaxID=267567 RepID=A0AAD8YG12_9STRA|nr:SKIP/SNW1 family protein [Skeletonema marinoi]